MKQDARVGLQNAQRREFVRSFVEQAWARPGADRPVSRVPVALMVTIGVLISAVLIGVVLQLLSPVPLVRPVVVAPTPTPPSYTAVSGWDCGTADDHGFDVAGRTAAWYTVATGGYGRDGCHGTFEAIPLSGHPDRADESQSAVWWFAPGKLMSRCQLAVYLPDAPRPGDAGATAARFTVLSGRSGGALAALVVDQTSLRGGWWMLGTYPVSEGGIAVRLDNQGVPANPAARLALTQVRAVCTGAA